MIHFLYDLNDLRRKEISINSSLILKNKRLITYEKYNFIKNLVILCWECDIIVNEVALLST